MALLWFLLEATIVVAGGMVLIWYGSMALGWGLKNHPASTILMTVAGLVLLGMSFYWLFPGCEVRGWGMFGASTVCRDR